MQLLLLLAMLLTSSDATANAALEAAPQQPPAVQSLLTALAAAAAPEIRNEPASSLIPFITEGNSMSPAIKSGDHLSVDGGYYKEHPLRRGDIIVFRAPDERAFVKRVVGLPGETIKLSRDALYVNGKRSADLSLKGNDTITENIELRKDELFVLGDNYAHSYDSRFIGPVKTDTVVGKVTKIDPEPVSGK